MYFENCTTLLSYILTLKNGILQYIFHTLQWYLRCQSKFRLHLSPTLINVNKFVSLN